MTTHTRVLAIVAILACVCGVSGAAAAAPAATSENARVVSNDADAWPQAVIERAVRVAATVRDPYRRAETLASIARAQALIEDSSATDRTIHEALGAARQITQLEFRGWVLHDIVLAQLAGNDLYGAQQTAERINAERPQGAAMAAIAEVQLRKSNLDAARTTALQIREDASRGLVLRQIAAIEASAGRIDAANATAKGIDDVFYRALACGDIAVAEIRRGNLDQALAQATRARRTYRGPVYSRIALAQFETGDLDGALKTLTKIEDVLQRALTQAQIAALRATTGDRARSQDLFAAALAAVDAADADRGRRPAVLAQIGRLQAASGDSAAASLTLQRAIAETQMQPAGEARDDALDFIARGQTKVGDATGALETAKLVSDRAARALLIRDTISVQGDAARAAGLAASAATLGDPLANTGALFGVLGVQMARSGDLATSETIDAARLAVRSVEDVEFRPAAFSALAAARVASGDLPGGRSIFEEALSAADSIEREDRRAATYVKIVNALNDRLVFLGQPMKKPGEDALRDR